MNKTEIQIEREKQKVQLEAKEIEQHCTFQPEINENSKIILQEQSLNQIQIPVGQRLFEKASEKTTKIEKLQQEQQESIYFPFKPNINTTIKGEKALEKPLFERLDKIIKEKHEMIIKLKEKQDLSSGVSFQPKIDLKSNQILNEKYGEGKALEIAQRFLQNAQDLEIKKQQQLQENQNNLMKNCPFSPVINPISLENFNEDKQQSNQNPNNNAIKQYQFADQLKEKLERKVKQMLEQEQATFNPKINKISEYLVDIDDDKALENQEQKVRRLAIKYQKDQEKKQQLIKQMEESYYKQFEFHPKINEISKVIGKKKNLDDLAYNKESQNHKKMLQEKYEQEKQQFNFEPSLNMNQKYQYIESKYKTGKAMKNIKEEQEKKKEKIQQLQKDFEYKTLQQCTFQPKIISNDINEFNLMMNVEVKGMEKVIEKREKIKQKKEEEKKRQEEIFNIENNYIYKRENKYTKPKPFQLSKGNQKTVKELMIESLEEQKKICTFQPQTKTYQKQNRESSKLL